MAFATYSYRELYFFYGSDCDICHSVMPDFDRFRSANPGIVCVALDTLHFPWEKYGYNPAKVPSYLYAVNRQPLQKYTGPLKEAQLARFIDGKLHQRAQRSREEADE